MVSLSPTYRLKAELRCEPIITLLPKDHNLLAELAYLEELGSSLDKKALLELRLTARNENNTPLIRMEAIKQLVVFLKNSNINISNMDYQNTICVLKSLVDSSEPKAIIESAVQALKDLGIR